MKDNKINIKERWLIAQKSNNYPITSIKQLNFDPNEKDIYGKSYNDYINMAREKFIKDHYKFS